VSQAELAVYPGVHPSTVYLWEAGQGQPSIGEAKRIAA
jgi:DNA-binding transcriptional regulator YiaG